MSEPRVTVDLNVGTAEEPIYCPIPIKPLSFDLVQVEVDDGGYIVSSGSKLLSPCAVCGYPYLLVCECHVRQGAD